MVNEELEQYKKTLKLYIESAQSEYRSSHPNCLYCECCKDIDWSYYKKECTITNLQFDTNWNSDLKKMKRKARWCKYYLPKTDLFKI